MNLHPHVIKSARFIMKNHAPIREWGWEPLLSWVNWHACMGFMATIMDENGKIVALGIIRPVAKPSDGLIPYEHDERGKHLYADLHISRHQLGLAGLSALFSRRYGPRESVSFFRKSETNLRTYQYQQLHRKTIRSTPPSVSATDAAPKGP